MQANPTTKPAILLTRYLDDGEQLGYTTARGSRLAFDALLRRAASEAGSPAASGGAWGGSLLLSWPGEGACGGNATWPPLETVVFLGVPPPVDVSTVYVVVRPAAALVRSETALPHWLGSAVAWATAAAVLLIIHLEGDIGAPQNVMADRQGCRP